MEDDNLLEGRDYVIEDGLLVFTAYYLQRRCFCCGNACRNCPYAATKALLCRK